LELSSTEVSSFLTGCQDVAGRVSGAVTLHTAAGNLFCRKQGYCVVTVTVV
jgi:hypothetical protein